MAGTTNTYNSNLALALTAAPQGVYDPQTQQDMDDHFSATQTLSQVMSDSVTTRILFLAAVPAGRFIRTATSLGEAIGITASATEIPVGFLAEDVAAGEYGIVYSQGINKFFSGLIPGAQYAVSVSGTVVNASGLATTHTLVGVALDANTLRVLPPVQIYFP